jgi:hypothetical protein
MDYQDRWTKIWLAIESVLSSRAGRSFQWNKLSICLRVNPAIQSSKQIGSQRFESEGTDFPRTVWPPPGWEDKSWNLVSLLQVSEKIKGVMRSGMNCTYIHPNCNDSQIRQSTEYETKIQWDWTAAQGESPIRETIRSRHVEGLLIPKCSKEKRSWEDDSWRGSFIPTEWQGQERRADAKAGVIVILSNQTWREFLMTKFNQHHRF